MKANQSLTTSVAIIGGGFSGTMLTVNFVKHLPKNHPFPITVIEQTGEFAKGLAYSTQDPHHFLNVRAGKMGAFKDDPEHFFKWLKSHEIEWKSQYPLLKVTPESYLPRKLYALYLSSLLELAKKEAKEKRIELLFLTDVVIDLFPTEKGLIDVKLKSGKTLTAKAVILATNLPQNQDIEIDPHIPPGSYIDNIWDPPKESLLIGKNLDQLPSSTRVAIIGTGLTMIDTCVSLIEKGYQGEIIAFSKHGRIPKPHHKKIDTASNLLNFQNVPNTALSLFKFIRREIALAEAKGIDWRAVLDSLRPITNCLWEQLSLQEQKRFIRHVIKIWHYNRHRIPPESYQILKEYWQKGKLQVIKGFVKAVRHSSNSQKVKVISQQELEVDYVVNCTGPQLDITKSTCPLLQNLLKQKIITPCKLKMGIETDEHFKVKGKGDPKIYALGMLIFGQKLETVAVPELREQCELIVNELSRTI